jgi:hypothetical protein
MWVGYVAHMRKMYAKWENNIEIDFAEILYEYVYFVKTFQDRLIGFISLYAYNVTTHHITLMTHILHQYVCNMANEVHGTESLTNQVPEPIKKFPTLYGIGKFITVFTATYH